MFCKIIVNVTIVLVIFGTVTNALEFSGRIVNGTNALLGQFPFIVSIRPIAINSHDCGGSFITDEWILTAAHCVVNFPYPENYTIQYGVVDVYSAVGVIAHLSEVIVHTGYDPSNQYIHDIALLRLERRALLNELVNVIKLPEQDEFVPDNADATLVGWGLDATNGNFQSILQKVNLFIYNYEACGLNHFDPVHSTNICAYYPGGLRGQCSGDSGGPLIHEQKIVGVVSWSVKPCGLAPYPGVFTRVSAYRDWIRAHINF